MSFLNDPRVVQLRPVKVVPPTPLFQETQRSSSGNSQRSAGSGNTPYAESALQSEIALIANATKGTRNGQLNTSAMKLGQLIAGGELDERDTANALYAAAMSCGLEVQESINTIRSGIKKGKTEPRGVPIRPADIWATGAGHPASQAATGLSAPESPHVDEVTGEVIPDPDDPAAARLAWAAANLQRLDWQALWDDESSEEWILEPILPARRLIALYSPPKVGKSLLMLEMAVAISTGRQCLGATIDRPRRVLYVDFENDPKADIRERLQAMGHGVSDLSDLVYLSYPTLAGLDSPRGGLELVAAVEYFQCEVVIIDTVSRAVQGEENENDTWLGFYRHTGLALKRSGVALIRLDHTGKDETKGQRGGSAKSGDVDAVWRLSKVTDTTFRLDCEANRMPVAERTLVLERLDVPHLHHHVNPLGRAAAFSAVEEAVIAYLDSVDFPLDAGLPTAAKAIRGTGLKARDRAISQALKIRKTRHFDGLGAVPDLGHSDPFGTAVPGIGHSAAQRCDFEA